jgi:YfiH family protein
MQFLQFDSLKDIPGLRHAITTRGGSCVGPYDELNLAYHVGDDAERVTANRKKLAAELGYDAASLVAAQQVHGSKVKPVWEEYIGRGAFDWEGARPQCDGLIVQASKIPVLIQVADCAPLLIVSQQKHMLAVVHAGWRGAVENIASDATIRIKLLWVEKSIQTSELKVGIGPCLCPDCFEIGPEVVEGAQKIAPEAIIQRDDWQKPHLDLRLLIQRDLEKIGVPPENIEIMPFCPRCNNDMFFSHRGQNGIAGRFGLVAWWEE